MVPAGERLGTRHGAPRGDRVRPPPGRLAPPGLLNAAAHAAMPAPYSHTEGRFLPSPRLSNAACERQSPPRRTSPPRLTGPCPRPLWTRCSNTSTRRMMPWHAWWSADNRPRRGRIWRGETPLECGKRLQAAILRYDALVACAPAAYRANAARHGIHCEAALRLSEEFGGASPRFRPATQSQLQEELKRQAASPEEDVRHLRALLAANRKRTIKDFCRRHAEDIVQR